MEYLQVYREILNTENEPGGTVPREIYSLSQDRKFGAASNCTIGIYCARCRTSQLREVTNGR